MKKQPLKETLKRIGGGHLLKEDIGTDTALGGIAQALKKAGIRVKKATVMKKAFMNRKSVVGFFITVDDDIVLPLEIRNGYVYYEIEDSHKLGKWADTNKVAKALKKFSKMDGFGQGKLVKKEGKLKEYRIRGNTDELVISKGDIKKGMMVWFEYGTSTAKKLKVKHVMLSKDKKEEHYVTNKGTFTASDVVGY